MASADDSTKTAPVHVDLLDEDQSLAGQKFCCLSFVSPEKIIKDFEQYKFAKFIDQYEWERTADTYIRFVKYISYKYNVPFNDMVTDLAEFREAEKEKLQGSSCAGHYKTFLEQNETSLLAEYSKAHQFQTAVRGIKVRGSYDTLEEAEHRVKYLQKRDKDHSIYVGQVGVWMPFHPEAYRTGRVEHLEGELNTLMHEKQKNEAEAKEHFDARIENAKKQAIEENMAKAEATGNKLTQRLDEDGTLTGANTMFQEELVQTYSGLKSELTEGAAAAGAAPDGMGHVDVAALLAADADGPAPDGQWGGNPPLE
jgi:hypothetical protein